VQINPLGLSPAPWLIAIGVVLTAILLARLSRMHERGEQPLFSMELFDNRTFFAAWGAALFAYVLSGALPFIVPVFSQQALGFDSLQSAVVMVAFSLGSIILGFASAKLLQRMQARTLMQVFLLVTITGLIWLVYVVDVNMTLVTFLLPMFVTGAGFGAISAQIPNIQLSNLRPRLQGEGSGFSETGKELGIGLGIAVIGSIMFSMAIGGLVDSVAREVNIPLTPEQRAETILLIEDEAFPEEAVDAISQQLPNVEEIGNEAFVEGFQIALGVLVAVLLVALLVASFIPKVETAQVTGEATRELVADVSSKRL
jgi:Na+/melibiose symporter-like transporter